MADHPNAQIARTGLEAFNAGDRETFASTVHDDVTWHAPGNNRFSGDFVGKAAALDRFREQMEAGVKLGFSDLHDVVANDDHVVALLTVTVTGPGGEASGRSVFVMHMRDGKLAEFWAMNDNQAEFDRVTDG
jgi:ketosteroid isomerase-like protein